MAPGVGAVILTTVTTTTMLPAAPPADYPPAVAFSSKAGAGSEDGDPPLHRWTVEEYDRAVALGALTPLMRVELLDGLITEKMPNDPPHASTVAALQELFGGPAGAGRWHLRSQWPLRLPVQDSEPEPDLLLVVPPRARYGARHPEPTDVLLLIEVADSTLLTDRQTKGPLYARAGVPEYWIVNVPGRTVEIFRDPDAEAGVYRVAAVARPGESVSPAAFPDAALAVTELFEAGTPLPG